ncbi:MAG: hypothetical protein ACRDDX_13760 [Cellulosilyticaceae bacterium]
MNKPQKGRRQNQKGGALLWVVLAMMIVVIFLGMIFTGVQNFVNRAAYSRDNRQAYLTARSVCHAVAQVLEDGKDAAFIDAVKGLQKGQTLELKDFEFQPEESKRDNNPSAYMPVAKGKVIKEDENTLKIIGEAEVGKGYEQVGLEMKVVQGGSGGDMGFYYKDGIEKDNIRLFTGKNTSLIREQNLSMPENTTHTGVVQIRMEDGDLMVKGSVDIRRTYGNIKGEGYINGRIIAEQDITLQNMRIGKPNATIGDHTSGIQTTGNVTLLTNTASEVQMEINGQIICRKLEIKPTNSKQGKIIINANIQASEGVWIDDKEISFSKEGSSEGKLSVEDYRLEDNKNVVFTGIIDGKEIPEKIPERPDMPPNWVQAAAYTEKEEILSIWDKVLEGGKYYILRQSGEGFPVTSINATPMNPIHIIIPSNIKATFNNIQGMSMEQGSEEFPYVRFIVAEDATLKLDGNNTYAHIYGIGSRSNIHVNSLNFNGSILANSITSMHQNITYHYVQDPIGNMGSGSTSFTKSIYVPK